ncbi:MAG TPA: DAK2 domain-containing protein, partial [Clostridia bacterium]|nr:DAK2 domain-containing protein [Clostridia bacterium]
MLAGASWHFETKVEMVNGLNVFPVPDGDTGTNMWLTLKSAVDSLEQAGELDLGKAADMA